MQHSVHPEPGSSVQGANGERKLEVFVFFRAFGKDNVKYIKLRSFDYEIDCKKTIRHIGFNPCVRPKGP